ncbi:ABC-2 type transport system permease protein [Microbacteriaceae bacterium SG_E_30_P1]|uniref:ABC-2 type transport system permease protein n=1 Tax=Antiquaquibacter oligotrophicus TaxID=2880260 RepID=A0ABT6KKQ8_9MICO|nr:hypothetical protein [Antiquaquibacter oligotrophicus]MDH6180454.1 ABC-2 type transport system permease protein [Antiquaquibacter oligotrophicus]UDF13808.1 hypothetical protein LH407_02840 [Antiquaquibacter oligotrophicus]
MVAQFLRLRLETLGNLIRRPPLQAFGMTIGILAGLALVVFTAGVLGSLRDESPDIARAVVITVGSVVSLIFALGALAFGADDSLEPRRFALLGIPPTRLTVMIGIASLVSIPVLSVLTLSFAQVVGWSENPAAIGYAVLVVPIIVATSALLGRVGSAIAALYLSTQRRREVVGLIAFATVVVAAPGIAALSAVDWGSHGLPIIRRIAAVATWTPFGAAWSVPADAAIGRTDDALLKLGIALGFLVLLALVWRLLVGRMLVSPQLQERRRPYRGLGWFGALPASPLTAVAARSLSYWGRDPRYLVSIAVVPVVALVVVGTLVIAGVPGEIIAWIPVPIMCLFLGWIVHNDVAQDSTAFWLHLSTSTAGYADRLGRIVPPLLIGLPLVVAGSFITVWVTGHPEFLLGVLGLSACVLFSALGVASVFSAAFPYPAVLPGANPFAQPQRTSSASSVVQVAAFVLPLLLAAPVVWFVVTGILDTGDFGTAFFVGLGIGLVALIGGVLWGGSIVDRRAPELLEFTLQN